ncbi:hypothetical protein HOC37_07585 [bacterium]|jgi:hypothetical protein|nr:hypothetical protein [bacterium]MBT4552818.1 hypothetical protein [bacterium]MBT5989012.1 hypothetical protein [bacterium]
MSVSIDFALIINILIVVALILLVVIMAELIRIVGSVRKLAKRAELLSDIKGWLGFFRKFSKD